MDVDIYEDYNEEDYQNQTSLNSFQTCLNTDSRVCLYSILLVEMTRKTTLWINFVLILVGLLVNLLVILVFMRPELRKLSISIHTVGLALSDISLLSFPVFFKWLNEYKPDFVLFKTNFWCKTHGYFDIVFCCWSAWNVVSLSNERWMAICNPKNVSLKKPNKRSSIIVIMTPIICFALFSWYPILIETNAAFRNMTNVNNMFGQAFCQPNNNNLLLLFGTFGIILTYIVPFSLITFYNSRIIKTLNQRIAKRKEYFNNGTFTNRNTSIASSQTSKKKCSTKIKISFSVEKIRSNTHDCINQDENLLSLSRANSKRNEFRRFSSELKQVPSPSSSSTTTALDDLAKRRSSINLDAISKAPNDYQSYDNIIDSSNKKSCGTNTEILWLREKLNQIQRVNNDRSINIMLITVSIAFLILTFPYQFVWIIDQIFRVFTNHKLNSLAMNEHPNYKINFFKNVWIYHLVSYSLKDIALTIRNLNFSINFFLYSTMSNLFRKELNTLFQNIGFNSFTLFKNSVSGTKSLTIYKVSSQKVYMNRTPVPSNAELNENKYLPIN